MAPTFPVTDKGARKYLTKHEDRNRALALERHLRGCFDPDAPAAPPVATIRVQPTQLTREERYAELKAARDARKVRVVRGSAEEKAMWLAAVSF